MSTPEHGFARNNTKSLFIPVEQTDLAVKQMPQLGGVGEMLLSPQEAACFAGLVDTIVDTTSQKSFVSARRLDSADRNSIVGSVGPDQVSTRAKLLRPVLAEKVPAVTEHYGYRMYGSAFQQLHLGRNAVRVDFTGADGAENTLWADDSGVALINDQPLDPDTLQTFYDEMAFDRDTEKIFGVDCLDDIFLGPSLLEFVSEGRELDEPNDALKENTAIIVGEDKLTVVAGNHVGEYDEGTGSYRAKNPRYALGEASITAIHSEDPERLMRRPMIDWPDIDSITTRVIFTAGKQVLVIQKSRDHRPLIINQHYATPSIHPVNNAFALVNHHYPYSMARGKGAASPIVFDARNGQMQYSPTLTETLNFTQVVQSQR